MLQVIPLLKEGRSDSIKIFLTERRNVSTPALPGPSLRHSFIQESQKRCLELLPELVVKPSILSRLQNLPPK